jgi:heme/copper-type cytochrome/quinol oxidase subunit 2
MGRRQLPLFMTLAACVLLLVSTVAQERAAAQDNAQVREFTVVGNHYAFAPAGLAVNRNDLVKITFTAQDIPHSFTVEGYRIMKRAAAGQTVTFEFRADKPGEFVFFCGLTQDEKCKNMKGTLTVR